MLRGHALFTQHLGSEIQAWAVLSQLVGAIVMARSMADEHLHLRKTYTNTSVLPLKQLLLR
jgi:TetR/AcrR family transcriptional regulator, transcriptional repressor for nem operon